MFPHLFACSNRHIWKWAHYIFCSFGKLKAKSSDHKILGFKGELHTYYAVHKTMAFGKSTEISHLLYMNISHNLTRQLLWDMLFLSHSSAFILCRLTMWDLFLMNFSKVVAELFYSVQRLWCNSFFYLRFIASSILMLMAIICEII